MVCVPSVEPRAACNRLEPRVACMHQAITLKIAGRVRRRGSASRPWFTSYPNGPDIARCDARCPTSATLVPKEVPA